MLGTNPGKGFFILQLATVYVPFLTPIFKTEPLPITDLLIVLLLSTAVFVAVEIEKLFKRRMGSSP